MPPQKAREKIKVFIADDSATVRERLVTMLADLDRIELAGQAQDAVAALDSIGKLKPEVVILDIRMPGGSGIEVLQRLKEEQPSPLVIMLTNYAYPQYRQKCLKAGADFFFDKSSEFDRIPEVLNQVRHEAQA